MGRDRPSAAWPESFQVVFAKPDRLAQKRKACETVPPGLWQFSRFL